MALRQFVSAEDRDEISGQLEKWASFMLANLLWALFSLPLVTLPAATAGLFAVMSRLVQQRQREFGIRLALGATPADLRRLVHNRTFALAALGVMAGTAVAWLLSRLMTAFWFGVQAADPLTWTGVVSLICLTTVIAAWRPARRAMRVNPVSLLREE